MIRPEQIRIHRADSGGPASGDRPSAVIATVRARTFYGHESAVELELEGVGAPLSARVLGHDVPEPGERVAVAVDGDVMAYPGPAPASRSGARPEPTPLLGPASR
jgi:iron(III) transport system ATP-binding protein